MLQEKPIWELAEIVSNDWNNISIYAKPYLSAMFTMKTINDNYLADSGQSIVSYFLANANSWRGETAREVKKELNRRLKEN